MSGLNERYASDVTAAEFALIGPLLPPARRGGRRRTTDLREVLNAILYLVRTGRQCRLLSFRRAARSTAILGAFGKTASGTRSG
jgi:transposase